MADIHTENKTSPPPRLWGQMKSATAQAEEKILQFWREKIYLKKLKKDSPAGNYVFTMVHRLRRAYLITVTF